MTDYIDMGRGGGHIPFQNVYFLGSGFPFLSLCKLSQQYIFLLKLYRNDLNYVTCSFAIVFLYYCICETWNNKANDIDELIYLHPNLT